MPHTIITHRHINHLIQHDANTILVSLNHNKLLPKNIPNRLLNCITKEQYEQIKIKYEKIYNEYLQTKNIKLKKFISYVAIVSIGSLTLGVGGYLLALSETVGFTIGLGSWIGGMSLISFYPNETNNISRKYIEEFNNFCQQISNNKIQVTKTNCDDFTSDILFTLS